MDPVLLTINTGYTFRAWPLNYQGKSIGYYFDNPGQPDNLRPFRDGHLKEEDHLKTGRVYLLSEDKIRESDAWKEAGIFRDNITNNDVEMYLQSGAIVPHTVESLVLYAVECGIRNMDMLRRFAHVLKWQGLENFIMTWPREDPDWCVKFVHGSIFIQPDGSSCM